MQSFFSVLDISSGLLLRGLGLTVAISAAAVLAGAIIGTFVGPVLTYGGRVASFPFRVFVDVVRGTPQVVRLTPEGATWVGPVAFPALQEPGLGIERQVAWTLLVLGLALLAATAVLLWTSRLRGRPPAATA